MKSILTWLWGRLPLGKQLRNRLVWLLSPKYTVGVVGLVRDNEGRVLLLRHTYRRRSPWGVPGGGLQPGETLEDCLRREIFEETGMRVEVKRLLSAGAHTDRKLVDMIFDCRPLPGESLAGFKPNAEIADARFFHPTDFPDGLPESLRRLIRIATRQADGDTHS
jgi:8-oxo-dGTP diphosphatase